MDKVEDKAKEETPDAAPVKKDPPPEFTNPELKLSKRQQRILGVKITRERSVAEKKRIEASTARLRAYNESKRKERKQAEAKVKEELGKRARVRIVDKPKRVKKRKVEVSVDSESDSESSEVEYRAKKASRAAKAIAKLDEKMSRVVARAPVNPYTAAFMRMQ